MTITVFRNEMTDKVTPLSYESDFDRCSLTDGLYN